MTVSCRAPVEGGWLIQRELAPVEHLRSGFRRDHELAGRHAILPQKAMFLNLLVCSVSAISTGRRSMLDAP